MSVELQGIAAVESPLYGLSVGVTTTATKLTELQETEAAAVFATIVTTKPWRGVWLQNQDAAINVFIKHRDSNTGSGLRLSPGEKEFIPERDLENIYLVAASGTPVVGVLVK